MPKLIRLYITQVAIGFALSAVFVGILLWLNVANLGHLVLSSDIGWLAVIMLVVFNGIVFSGVQFAIAIMRLADDEPPQRPGRKLPILAPVLISVKHEEHTVTKR